MKQTNERMIHMNIIRTKAVELSTIPALAFKQKLAAGGSGIKIIRLDQELSASASIDRRTGAPVAYSQANEELFPQEAFDEALDLTSGLPYSARGKLKLVVAAQIEENDVSEIDAVENMEKRDMVASDEYKAIVERYSDEKGKMNYALLNKDFIQFAAKSKVVGEMVANREETDKILNFIVQSRAALAANKNDSLSFGETAALIDTIDEIDPRSAFKELKSHVNKLLAKEKRA